MREFPLLLDVCVRRMARGCERVVCECGVSDAWENGGRTCVRECNCELVLNEAP